jgi:murein DD-endopeptidase MepM/ murein hydrolase activator NlpD
MTRSRLVPYARYLLTIAGLCASLGGSLGAQHAHLSAAPARATPGAIVRLTIAGAGVSGDTIVAIRGEMAGEPLHFIAAAGGEYRAIGAVPVESTGNVVARAIVERASGRRDTAQAVIEGIAPPAPPAERLAVGARFGRPPDSATRARVEREAARAREIGRRSHESPLSWSEAFLHPRPSAITSRFGTGRTFNGRVTSRHLGVDFQGAVGAAVHAANRGVVALVDTFFLGGNVVYIDHGAGVVTGYMHLSRPLVSVGDTVARGQPIGLVGATGRTTGPHLHWSARYGTLTVDPLDLVALGRDWYNGSRAR